MARLEIQSYGGAPAEVTYMILAEGGAVQPVDINSNDHHAEAPVTGVQAASGTLGGGVDTWDVNGNIHRFAVNASAEYEVRLDGDPVNEETIEREFSEDYQLPDHEHPNMVPEDHDHSGMVPETHDHPDRVPSDHDHPNLVPEDHDHPNMVPEDHEHDDGGGGIDAKILALGVGAGALITK